MPSLPNLPNSATNGPNNAMYGMAQAQDYATVSHDAPPRNLNSRSAMKIKPSYETINPAPVYSQVQQKYNFSKYENH
jgi:hypothetical protein